MGWDEKGAEEGTRRHKDEGEREDWRERERERKDVR